MTWMMYILLMGAFFQVGSRPNTVNIGSIFTFSTTNGKVAKIAMDAAVEDINSDPKFLGGTKLSMYKHDTNYSGFLGIIGALQFMETDVVAIIGPQTSTAGHVLSHLANELHVPLVSFTALDPTLSPLQYPYFIQTAPNDLFQMQAIAEILTYFDYKEVIAMFSDDDGGRNGISVLGDELAERRCKFSYKAAIPSEPEVTREQVRDQLLKVSSVESRVIVVHTYMKTGLLVFELAKQLGMMEQGYVWIATTWLMNHLDSTKLIHLGNAKNIEGVITLRPHTPDSKKKREFINKWNKLSNGSIGLNAYGLYAYDTVWIIANAVKMFLDQNGTISFSNDSNLSGLDGGGTLNLSALSIFDGGQDIRDNILKTNMTGVTGPLGFNLDRATLHPAFDIINVINNGSHQIGYWSNYSGLSVVTPESLYDKPANRSSSSQALGSMLWPGGTRTKPRGWVLSKNGNKLRIAVPNRVGYKEFVSRNESTGEIQGYCVDVFDAALKLLPYPVPYEFVLFGDGRKNPNYGDLVRRITTNEFDAAIGDIAIVTNRSKIVDFTQPYIESGLVILVPIPKLNSSAWAFSRPFTPLMWGVTAAFFLIVGAVVWVLEHRTNDEFRGPPRKQLVTILWFSFSTMFFAHRENTVSTLGRFVLLIWLFVVLIINSSYTASLTSILTVQQLSLKIKGLESLISGNERIGFQVGSFAQNYLIEELDIAKSRLVPLGSPQEYAKALENGTVAAVVDEKPYVDMFLSSYCKFTVVGQAFTRSGWGFAFPRDSPLAVDMSTAILTLSENGELQRIHDRRLNKKSCGPSGSQLLSDQLNLTSFWGLFVICGIICLIALAIYLCLMLHKFKRYSPEATDPSSHVSGSGRSARLQRFLSFVDEKAEVSKSRRKRKRAEGGSVDGGGEIEIGNGSSRRDGISEERC